MKHLKRILCIILCATILSLSVGTTWFDSNHMEKVEATGAEIATVALSAAAMYAICYYVGTIAYMYAPVESVSLPDEQIVSTGYSLISCAVASNVLDNPTLATSPVVGFVDKVGQSYLYGTEAFKEIAETELRVIMGGKKPDDDGNDDNDDEKEEDTSSDDKSGIVNNVVHMLGNVKELSACCSLAFGGILGSLIKDQYNNYMNGDTSIYDDFISNSITASDIKEQWSGASINYSGSAVNYMTFSEGYYKYYCTFSNEYSVPIAGYRKDGYAGVWFLQGTKATTAKLYIDSSYVSSYNNKYTPTYYFMTSPNSSIYARDMSLQTCSSWSYNDSTNFPVFSSQIAAETYLKNRGEGYENALNYVNAYRPADWLSNDWSGTLLDPLTGLNALSDLYNIARHQGLNALGSDFDFSQFVEFLRDYFENLKNSILPDIDPTLDPVVYPIGSPYPDYSYDPAKNPAIQPSNGSNPGIDPTPSPGTDPTPNPDTTYPIDDIVPDISDSLGDLCGNLRYKFPFSIPWDIQYMLSCLADTPRTPHFELPLVIKRFGINEMLIIDMSNLQMLSTLSRSMFSMLFAIYLVNLTFKVVGMRKEE